MKKTAKPAKPKPASSVKKPSAKPVKPVAMTGGGPRKKGYA